MLRRLTTYRAPRGIVRWPWCEVSRVLRSRVVEKKRMSLGRMLLIVDLMILVEIRKVR